MHVHVRTPVCAHVYGVSGCTHIMHVCCTWPLGSPTTHKSTLCDCKVELHHGQYVSPMKHTPRDGMHKALTTCPGRSPAHGNSTTPSVRVDLHAQISFSGITPIGTPQVVSIATLSLVNLDNEDEPAQCLIHLFS